MENGDRDLVDIIGEVTEVSNKLSSSTEKDYIDANITPMLNIINLLANVSSNLSDSVDTLQSTYLVNPKRHKLKDTIDLVYDINEECEDIYDVLKKRIRPLLHDNPFYDKE